MLEKELQEKFCSYLESQKVSYQQKVVCSFGIADIVTEDSIFEVKREITKYTLKVAVSQLLAYSSCIGGKKNLYIVGEINDKEYRDYAQYAKDHLIRMIIFNDGSFVDSEYRHRKIRPVLNKDRDLGEFFYQAVSMITRKPEVMERGYETKEEFVERYIQVCEDHGIDPLGEKQVTSSLEKLGIIVERKFVEGKRIRVYTGIQFK